ncbi:MAG: cytochrome P450 [bacterium]|nr:cytochrome P450 [bacterium]
MPTRLGGGDASEAEAIAVFDPFAPSYIENPYPTYAALRQHDPVHRSSSGLWVLTRYDDVASALENPSLGNQPSAYALLNERNRSRYVCADVANSILPFLDAPKHTAPRKLIGRTFNGNLRRQALDMSGIADRLLEPYRERGSIELVGDFGLPYTMALVGQLLGVPEDDYDHLKECSEWFFYLFAPMPSDEVRVRVDKALIEFRRYFAALIGERRRAPRGDLVSELISAEVSGHRLGEAELIDTCMLLYADGVENIDSGFALAVLALLDHPEQLERLKRHPELMGHAANELLRYDTPAHFLARTAREDLSIRGREIHENDGVLLMLASANHDPEQFANPDTLDIGRDPNLHLSFGRGRHSCIGATFATTLFTAGLRAIVEGLPDFAVASSERKWIPRLGHRWLAELPLTFTARA